MLAADARQAWPHAQALSGESAWHGRTRGAKTARAAFWLTVLYAGLLFWLAPHPPMADLPQHAGQIALLRDLLMGQSPWESLLRINYFTPYLIGYGLAVPLSLLIPVAAALKLLLMLAFYAFVICCVLLRRHFNADERLEWLFIPGYFGFAYVYGFFSFLLAAPVGLLFILLADRYARSPALAGGVRLAIAGLILFFSHGLVFLFACSVGVALLLVHSKRWQSMVFALFAYAPLALLSLAYAFVSRHAEAAISNGSLETFWLKWETRLNFLAYIFGARYDAYDVAFAAVAGVLMFWMPRLLGSSLNRMEPAAFIPMAALVLVWCTAPYYTMKISFIYHRFALFILPFYALMFCRSASSGISKPADGIQARVCHVLVALLCWVFLVEKTQEMLRFAKESSEFDTVRAAVEPGQRALSLPFTVHSAAARSTVAYAHHALWYQAENKGFVDVNYAWAASQLIRFRDDRVPAVQLYSNPEEFDWIRDRGWEYRYIFVRKSEPLPPTFLKNDQCDISLLKSAGHWSVYETQRCEPR